LSELTFAFARVENETQVRELLTESGLPDEDIAPHLRQLSQVLERIAGLLEKARAARVPVLYVQHDGRSGHRLEPNTPGWPIHPAIAPVADEPVVRKRASDSFFETDLQQRLQSLGVTHLVVTGSMTEHCVDTTCRRAVTLGYDVTLVGDAHTTADTTALKASQIIAHHNELLDGFAAGSHSITVVPARELVFTEP
jgi:nicotinamidase-related amidase